MRLQKYLAQCGIASRRKCELYIHNGEVAVNGKIITEMGYIVDPYKDHITFRGNDVKNPENNVYLLLNKPKETVTTSKDQFNRKSVIDLVDVPQRVYPVGRLDYHTTGLLILTNDGELAQRLTHPSHSIEKIYQALVKGEVSQDTLQKLRLGIEIDGRKTRKATARIVRSYTGKNRTLLEIGIKEGRNRQVRKMCEAVDHPVIYLKRISVGSLTIGNLKPGEYRNLKPEEVNRLKKEAGMVL
ncbi:MAG: rRNA pseudouridine synthase [Tindallia sp. MSAO_Bac2]|nr:MAG: rRNA pseudouridine synthase [Tindallia sp. MSAO_Bac2]